SSLLLICMRDEYGADDNRLTPVIFALCLYVKSIRRRTFTRATITEIKQLSSLIQTELLNSDLKRIFTYKMHVVLEHLPERMNEYGSIDDFSLSSFEAINKLI
ncbi:hypothetical protein PMAYCL1PPCAC_24592, partial [Pristionchus mayeri]